MNQLLRTGVLATILSFLGGASHAGEPIALPPGGDDVVAFDENQTFELNTERAESNVEWTTIDGMSFRSAYRVNLMRRPSTTDNVQVGVPTTRAIQKGSAMLLSFWIRRPMSGGEPGPSVLYVQAGPDKPRYEFKFSAYRDWQQYVRAFAAPASFDPIESSISIHVGNSGEAIEIADLRLVDYGVDIDIKSLPRSATTYQGRDPDAQWRKDALTRIDKIRKGDLTIEVLDADGSPVKDATVKVQMQRHAFGFGSAVNSLLIGGDESAFPYTHKRSGIEKTSTWQDAQKYREIVEEYFNVVTFESGLRPHVWKEMMSGNARAADMQKVFIQQAVPWLQSNGIGIRGHYLAWGAIDFNAVEKRFIGNPAAHRKWLWDHMADVLPKTVEYVTEWDTINHIIGWGEHTYEKEYGGFDIYTEIMEEARHLAPDARHCVNEGKVLPDGYKREPYKQVIRFLNDNGQAPDRVGFMAHFELTSLTPPEELLAVYDDFAEVAPSMQLTEFDVETGDDEQLQADYFRDVMIATFSHPNLKAIVQWGFWEKAHWKSAAALWRSDWSLKPSGEVFVDLVKNRWWTDEVTTTNEQGHCQVRGFLGNYKIIVDHQGRSVTKRAVLDCGGTHIRIRLSQAFIPKIRG